MELKYYLRILQRRWPIVVIVPLLISLVVVYQESVRDPRYSTSMEAIVNHMPGNEDTEDFRFDNAYNFQSSEYAVDDMVLALRGDVFAEGVAERIREQGGDIAAGEIQGAIAVDRRHRVVTMSVSSYDPDRAAVIAEAAADELVDGASNYLGATDIGSEIVVRMTDLPGVPGPDTTRAQLLMLLQLMAAVGAGVLLAFLIDYLDDTLYDGESAAFAIGVPHLVSVPVERRA